MKRFASTLLALAACSSGSGDAPRPIDGGHARRMIEPPPGQVRALPPHAIDAGGVGPYRLGATQSDLFAVLPEQIPRVAILDIDGVIDTSVVRTEDEMLLVGPMPGDAVSFIAVLSSGIARTSGGLGVGARRSELAVLGPQVSDPRQAHDPRIVMPASMPGARFLLDGDHVSAILVEAAPDAGGAPRDAGVSDAPASPCAHALPASEADILAAAGVKDASGAQIHGACLGTTGGEAIVTAGESVIVVDGEAGRARRVASADQRGLVWAAPVLDDEDREAIVAISESRSDGELSLALTVFRLEAGRLVRGADEPVYHLTRTSAQWIGARLDELRLLLTVDSRPDTFQVGGVLVHTVGGGVRDVAPLKPVTVARRRHQAVEAPSEPDAAVPPPHDAREAPRDAGIR